MKTKIISKFELTPENWLMGDLDVDESLLEPIFRKFPNENFNEMLNDISVWCMDGNELQINFGLENGMAQINLELDDAFCALLDENNGGFEKQHEAALKLRNLADRIDKAAEKWESNAL